MQKIQGWGQDGGKVVTTAGLSSTTKVQQSYPSCTVTVYNTGTLTLATIYSDNSSTPKSNPFTAASSGQWFFYAANGRYDVKFSGTGITSPFTLGDFSLYDASTSAWSQGGNSFGATGILGTLDNFDLNLIRNNVTQANFKLSQTTLTNSSAGGNTLKLDNTNGGSGASTSISFYKNGVYVGMVGDRGTTGQIELQHSSGIELILGSGAATLNGASSGLQINGGGLTVGVSGSQGVNAGSLSIAGTQTIDISRNVFPNTVIFPNVGIPSTPATGFVTLYSLGNQLYYKDSGGTITGPLGASGGGGTFWNAASTAHTTNSLSTTTYFGGNNTANTTIIFTQNEVESFRIGPGTLVGFNTLATAARQVEIKDTGGIPLRLTGPATGGVGVAMEWYETTTLAAQITAAKGTVFAISTVGSTPITLNSNSTQCAKIYKSGSDIILQASGLLEVTGFATGAFGLSGAGTGRLIFDSTLNHFYMSENGGAYFQVNAGTGGTGWPIGSAANDAALYAAGATAFIGNKTNFDMAFSTNSLEGMRLLKSQILTIGSTVAGPQSSPLYAKTTGTALAELGTTGNTGALYLGVSSWGTSTTLTMSSIIGFRVATTTALPIGFSTNSIDAMDITTLQHVGIGTTSPTGRLHVKDLVNATTTVTIESNSTNAIEIFDTGGKSVTIGAISGSASGSATLATGSGGTQLVLQNGTGGGTASISHIMYGFSAGGFAASATTNGYVFLRQNTFANLPTAPGGFPFQTAAYMVFCSDAKNIHDDSVAAGSIATSGGHGCMLQGVNGNWLVM